MKINQGGLMRCCIKTLQDGIADGSLAEVVVTKCRYCGAPMLREGDTWKWDMKEDKKS